MLLPVILSELRPGLARDHFPVRSEDTVRARDLEPDPVGEAEARFLPQFLDRPDQVAGRALAFQFVRDLRMDADDDALIGCDILSFSCAVQYLGFIGAE